MNLWLTAAMVAILGGAALDQQPISRAELEARAHAVEQRVIELKNEINENQQAIQANLHTITELQRTLAEVRTKQAMWGGVITVLTSSGVLVAIFKRKTKE